MPDEKKLQVRETQATLTRWILVQYSQNGDGWRIASTSLHGDKPEALDNISVKRETRFRLYQVEIPFIPPVTE